MDGTNKARRKRWIQRAESAFERMFEGKSEEELVTLTQRENMAVLIAKELAAFLLEEHVAKDSAAQPEEASTACCPKCGQPGVPSPKKGEELEKRVVTTRVGRIHMQRQRWECPKCRIAFFPTGRSVGVGDGRL